MEQERQGDAPASPAAIEGGYKLTSEDYALVMSATSSLDVPVKVRNKLYAALARALAKPNVSDKVLARWSEDQEASASKFQFLKEWCKDTNFGEITITETHIRKSEAVKELTMGYYTQVDLELKYKGIPSASEFIAKIMSTAKSIPHPMFPKDKALRMFRVLDAFKEGRKDTNIQEKQATVAGTAVGEGAAKALENVFSKPVLSDEQLFTAAMDTAKTTPQPKEQAKAKGKAKAKAKADALMDAEPAALAEQIGKSASKVMKLNICASRLGALEFDMSTLRKRLEDKKPAMKTLLDSHIYTVEDLKSKIEIAIISDETDAGVLKDLSDQTAAVLADKKMKDDIATANKQVK